MIDPIFNKFKTKYPILDTLNMFRPNANKVVVYINLESVLRVLFTTKVNNQLIAEQDENDVKVAIVSNIINLAQHYRWYFIRYGHCDCDAYIYWNYPSGNYNNYEFNLNYRSYHNNKMYHSSSCIYLTKCIHDSYKTLKLICKYVNGVNIINHDKVESSVIPYIIYSDIYKYDNSIQHVLVSNDKYDLQYVKYGFDIIVPRQDKTVIIDRTTVIEHLKNSFNITSDNDAPYKQIVMILSLIGDKYRSIPKMNGIGMGSILKTIQAAIDKVLITENTSDLSTLSSIIKSEYQEQFINNYKCIDVTYQYNMTPPLDIHNILDQIIDKYDDNTLDMINEKYFQNHPILSFYNHKEQMYNRNVEKSIFDR